MHMCVCDSMCIYIYIHTHVGCLGLEAGLGRDQSGGTRFCQYICHYAALKIHFKESISDSKEIASRLIFFEKLKIIKSGTTSAKNKLIATCLALLV